MLWAMNYNELSPVSPDTFPTKTGIKSYILRARLQLDGQKLCRMMVFESLGWSNYSDLTRPHPES